MTSSTMMISVWHGGVDLTVDSSNADSIVRQWQKLHKVGGPPTRVEKVDGFPRQVWCDADGLEVIEEYIIERMGHGTPISAGGDEGLGEESNGRTGSASVSARRGQLFGRLQQRWHSFSRPQGGLQ
jgi:poly(3-hydroxybutyrate) depolymerase